MQENIITWNVANWVTVVLMALVGFMALGAISAFVRGKRDKSGTVNSQVPQSGA